MCRIAVIGSDEDVGDDVSSMALQIGKDIADAGCVLVCGGRGGVMELACRGAKGAGGLTVGILPSFDKSEANEYVDIPITTGMGYTRNCLVVSCADAVIAIAGRTGTLSEMAMAINFDKPVVAVSGTGGFADSLKDNYPDYGGLSNLIQAKPEDAVKTALSLIR